ncbi:DMT family transporter [Litorihabitans aurantiacus]|uniref:QacE family quaternary ammonium compound efflux SMR transporter n=1 Tax=Litorihabitans aurantiacus TaxID=1930061 RepID=A0AA38CSZ7_9MICO|nr:multidrug efflux SMR transporter [Litorihabitans aurantiacus]GMA31989.1 QacE family quaternary ammonium compound efflux SMR transporter [Litorihabitans aurantiacus]
MSAATSAAPGSRSARTAWTVLLVSAVLEAVWATALGLSAGFTLLAPTVVFGVALALSMVGLAIAMRAIPMGTAYAVWVGVGAALTVTWAMLTGVESASPAKVALLVGIVGCVVGLKLVAPAPPAQEDRGGSAA